jgi:hypothetical protein
VLKVERILLSFDCLDDGMEEDCFGSGGEIIFGEYGGGGKHWGCTFYIGGDEERWGGGVSDVQR